MRRSWTLRARALFESLSHLTTFRRELRHKPLRRTALRVNRLEDRTVPALTGLGEFEPHTTKSGDQHFPAVAADTLGNYAVVWQSSGQDGAGWGIYGQRYDSTGQRIGVEFPVNTGWQGDQTAPAIAMAPDGAFVVVWASAGPSSPETDVRGRRFDAAGVAQGNDFPVTVETDSYQLHPAVAIGADGAFVAVWQSYYQDGSGYGIFGQRFNAAGVAQGEFPINAELSDHQWYPTVAVGQGGNFLVAWQGENQDGDGAGIFARRYDAAGVEQEEEEFPVNTSYVANQMVPASASVASDGSFAIGWQSNATGDYDVVVRAFNAAGEAQTAEIVANTERGGYQGNVAVAMAPGGRFIAAWESVGQDGSGSGVFAQEFGADGVRWGDEFPVNSFTDGDQWAVEVAADGRGGYLFAWMSAGHDGNGLGVVGQQFSGFCDYTPLVRLEAIDPTAARWKTDEAHGTSTGAFLVWRTGDLSEELTVYYSVSPDSTAVAGGDYEPLSGSVTIEAGQRGAGILVEPRDDPNYFYATRSVKIVLEPSFAYSGDGAEATVTINEPSTAHPRPIIFVPNAEFVLDGIDPHAAELPGDETSTGLALARRVVQINQPPADSSTEAYNEPVTLTYTVNPSSTAPYHDYEELPLTVDLPLDVFAGPIVLTPVNDDQPEAPEPFTIQIGTGPGDTAVVTIYDDDLRPNQAPYAGNNSYETSWNSRPELLNRLDIGAPGFIEDDTDADGDPLYVKSATTPAHAAEFSWTCDGGFVYVPEQGFVGEDTFTYVVSDGMADATATVTINVVNHAPVAVDNDYEAAAGKTLSIGAPAVLGNDYDPDQDSLTARLDGTLPLQTLYGTVTEFHADGSFKWQPNPGITSATDYFRYYATDGQLEASALVAINLAADTVKSDIRVYEVLYGDGTTIASDNLDGNRFVPLTIHWLDKDLNGYTGTAQGERDDPYAYAQGEAIKIRSAKFKPLSGEPLTPGSTIQVKGTISTRRWTLQTIESLARIKEVTATADPTGEYYVVNDIVPVQLSSDQPYQFPFVTAVHASFRISWEVSAAQGQAFKDANTSSNRMYVAYKPPQGALERGRIPVMQTLLEYGTEHADASALVESFDVFNRIWSRFEGANAIRYAGQRLYYYKKWYAPYYQKSYAHLISDAEHDGQCGNWTGLLYAAMLANGINGDLGIGGVPAELTRLERTGRTEGMLIGPWSFFRENNIDPVYKYVNLTAPAVGEPFKDYPAFDNDSYIWQGESKPVQNILSFRGQNNDRPLASFLNHVLVKVDGRLYDPSYGRVYTNLQDFQQRAVGGFYIIEGSWNQQRRFLARPNDGQFVLTSAPISPRGLGW